MKASVYHLAGPRQLVLDEEELATNALEPDQILARTTYSVISPGTELAAWSGKPPLRPGRVYPRLMGYCNVAVVTACAPGVTGVRVGDHILTHQAHRSAFRCGPANVLLSSAPLDTEDQQRLATTYLFHLGYSALLDASYVPGHEVAVIGYGALGYTTASLVQAFGGKPLVFTRRPAAVQALSPWASVQASSELPGRFTPPSGLDGCDIVVNTSDSWADHLLALKVVRTGGTVVSIGFPGRGQKAPDFNPLDARYLYDKHLTFRQAGHVVEGDLAAEDVRFTLKRNLRYLFGLMGREVIDPGPLLRMVYSWRNLNRAYEDLAARETPSLAAVLDWQC